METGDMTPMISTPIEERMVPSDSAMAESCGGDDVGSGGEGDFRSEESLGGKG